eukprot:COSAG04_NODE_420_length_14643_cov_3.634007_2_plen_358_part_00
MGASLSRRIVAAVVVAVGGVVAWQLSRRKLDAPPPMPAPSSDDEEASSAAAGAGGASPKPGGAAAGGASPATPKGKSSPRLEPGADGAAEDDADGANSPAPSEKGTPKARRVDKNAALVEKFMTQMVLPLLHDKLKELLGVEAKKERARAAATSEKPNLFIQLGEACFAQLVVALQAFMLLEMLISTKLNMEMRSRAKHPSKQQNIVAIKSRIQKSVEAFLAQGLPKLVLDARAVVAENLAQFPTNAKPVARLKGRCDLDGVLGIVDKVRHTQPLLCANFCTASTLTNSVDLGRCFAGWRSVRRGRRSQRTPGAAWGRRWSTSHPPWPPTPTPLACCGTTPLTFRPLRSLCRFCPSL